MKLCRTCNRTFADEAHFCADDGAPLEIIPTDAKCCPKCGRVYASDATFCGADGTALAAHVAPSAAANRVVDVSASKANSTGEGPRKRKRSGRPKATPAAGLKHGFAAGMSTWLQNAGYHVGLSAQPVDTKGDLEFARKPQASCRKWSVSRRRCGSQADLVRESSFVP
jgi:hypothetical protein